MSTWQEWYYDKYWGKSSDQVTKENQSRVEDTKVSDISLEGMLIHPLKFAKKKVCSFFPSSKRIRDQVKIKKLQIQWTKVKVRYLPQMFYAYI